MTKEDINTIIGICDKNYPKEDIEELSEFQDGARSAINLIKADILSNPLEHLVIPKIADKLEKLQQHIKICPIGWFDNKMKVFRTTTEEEVLIWLKKLHDISNFSE